MERRTRYRAPHPFLKRAVFLLVVLILAGGGSACKSRLAASPTPVPAPTVTPLPAPAVTPLPLWAPGWKEVTVRTLCLEVEQSYPEIPHKSPEPIAQATRKILSGLGLHVVAVGDPCDATLALAVTGQPLGGDYLLEGYCYTGARVEGQAALTIPGRAPLTVPLAGLQLLPPRIQHCPKDPTDAPFEVVWLEALLGSLFDLWGPQVLIQTLGDERVLTRSLAASVLIEVGPEASEAVPALIQALEDADETVRASAAQALREIGPQAIDAVPALIQALADPRPQVWQSAVIALRRITGRDFAEDAASWQQWWENGRPGTPVPSATAPPTPACTRDAAFEADVTIPDAISGSGSLAENRWTHAGRKLTSSTQAGRTWPECQQPSSPAWPSGERSRRR